MLLARRDNSKFVKRIYEETVNQVFQRLYKETILNKIVEEILFNLMYRNINYEDFKITKSVSDYNDCDINYDEKTGKYMMGNYIVPDAPLHLTDEEKKQFCINRLPAQVQLEIKMLQGHEKCEGSRMEYIVTDRMCAAKQSEKIEQFNKFIENEDILNIDVLYYIERV